AEVRQRMHPAIDIRQGEVWRLESLDEVVLSRLARSEEPYGVLLIKCRRLVDHPRKLAEVENGGAALPGHEAVLLVLWNWKAEFIPADALRLDLEFCGSGKIGGRNP